MLVTVAELREVVSQFIIIRNPLLLAPLGYALTLFHSLNESPLVLAGSCPYTG
jgi:hypothetical protein